MDPQLARDRHDSKQMSGGVHAKRGFNYQDTVVLDLLITHFDEHGSSCSVRPEGLDDLELTWETSDGPVRKRFVQVKKPREDSATTPKRTPWTLADITRELMPGALLRLKGNTWEQHWILGDGLSTDVRNLLTAGNDAATEVPTLYWLTVHRLARPRISIGDCMEEGKRHLLNRWRPHSGFLATPDVAVSHLLGDFGKKIEEYLSSEAADDYRRSVNQVHAVLPDVLSRIRVHSEYGHEKSVAERVRRVLHQRYNLDQDIVHTTLFRNLRGFVNDVSTIPGRQFNAEEFETEIRTIWPTMMPIRNPPLIDDGHLDRSDLSAQFTSQWSGHALEAIGISGAGKTMLAAEVYGRSRLESPARPVFYVEVRPTTELRDVLIGVAFHLRRYGNVDAFRIASVHANGNTPHDDALTALACAISRTSKDCLLIIDLIEGSCSEAFAKDLRTLLGARSKPICRLAVLGQQSAFRELGDVERHQARLKSVDIRGFSFDEFVTLVCQKHGDFDYHALRDIFDTVTAGRGAGLFARLARSLADASSLEEMRDISQSRPEQLLQRSERTKFEALSSSARQAAARLICFALPFGRAEAESVFPDVSVGIAILELLENGLIRKTADDSFEMHETVRAGLEGAVARGTIREAHRALAHHYAEAKMLSAQILHLERAGQELEARSFARTAFLEGTHWPQLYRYVGSRRLVTAGEAMAVVSSCRRVEGIHLLPDIMSVLGGPAEAETVLGVVRGQLSRFEDDFNWGIAMAEAYLALAPERGHELYRTVFLASGSEGQRKSAITAGLIASRHRGSIDRRAVIALFDVLSPEHQRALVPVLLESGGRHCLRRAFRAMLDQAGSNAEGHLAGLDVVSLRVNGLDSVVEFLASIPEAEDAKMLLRRSPLLGRLAPYIWKNRKSLDEHCVTVLKSEKAEPEIQKAAIRVLALTGNGNLCALCEEIGLRTENPIHGFAMLAPLLAPSLVDVRQYEAKAMDSTRPLVSRVASLRIIAAADGDLDYWYGGLCDRDGEGISTDIWGMLLLPLACEYPFRAAIPILERQLATLEERQIGTCACAVISLGMLPFPEAADILKGAIVHTNGRVRMAGALGLQEKRLQSARDDLLQQLRSERDEETRSIVAASIAASLPRGVTDLRVFYERSKGLLLWQCVVAARTRDDSFAAELVRIATKEALNWQVRIAALAAAGYLPFEVALEHMLSSVRHGSSLDIDNHSGLFVHSFLSYLIDQERVYLVRKFKAGREAFVTSVAEVVDDSANELLDKENVPCGSAVGEWAYRQLSAAGWPNNPDAPDVVINELKTPLLFSEGLRSLRRVGRRDLIAGEIGRAQKSWNVIKCLLEFRKSGDVSGEEVGRLRSLVERSKVGKSWRIDGIMEEIAGRRGKLGEPPAPCRESPKQSVARLSYQEAVRLLTVDRGSEELSDDAPVLLAELTSEQFEHLVRLADPGRDPETGVVQYVPGVSFRGEGYTVARRQVTYRGETATAGFLIRPAIIAANWSGAEVGWHAEGQRGAFGEKYMERVIRCVAVAGNGTVLYELLDRDDGRLLEMLGTSSIWFHIRELIDYRIIPILSAYVSSGTDEMMECLARLAGLVVSPDIDGVVASLWERWAAQFRGLQRDDVGDVSHESWRAFRELCNHPRFEMIKDWHRNLARVLYSPRLVGFRRREVLRVLERSPRSYIHLERARLNVEDWEHHWEEEVDFLEEACERLFSAVE